MLEASFITNDAQLRDKYTTAAEEIAARHVVTIYVKPARLQQMEYNHRFIERGERNRLQVLEEADPSNWQPLDDMLTFRHYELIHGFGAFTTQKLRITEGTADYRLKNNRYREFVYEKERMSRLVQDINDDKFCFGYAQYVHPGDANSTEWRQAIIQTHENTVQGTERRFKATFLHVPPEYAREADELDDAAVLLAPSLPRIQGSAAIEHQELLTKVHQLYEEEGMTEADIVSQLNGELQAAWQKRNEIGKEAMPQSMPEQQTLSLPPPITLAHVQHALKSVD